MAVPASLGFAVSDISFLAGPRPIRVDQDEIFKLMSKRFWIAGLGGLGSLVWPTKWMPPSMRHHCAASRRVRLEAEPGAGLMRAGSHRLTRRPSGVACCPGDGRRRLPPGMATCQVAAVSGLWPCAVGLGGRHPRAGWRGSWSCDVAVLCRSTARFYGIRGCPARTSRVVSGPVPDSVSRVVEKGQRRSR